MKTIKITKPEIEPLLLRTSEAATKLAVSHGKILAMIRSGELRPIHVGRSVRLTVASLEAYIAAKETEASHADSAA